jgi:hypothetical protein
VKYRVLIAACLSLGLTAPAFADVIIEAIPTGWRLQNYTGSPGLVTWFTNSSCTNGMLTFPASTTEEVRNRYYSLVLSSKLAGKPVGIYYETTSGSCMIASFCSP